MLLGSRSLRTRQQAIEMFTLQVPVNWLSLRSSLLSLMRAPIDPGMDPVQDKDKSVTKFILRMYSIFDEQLGLTNAHAEHML